MLLKAGRVMLRRRLIAALLVLTGLGLGGALAPGDASAAAHLSALSTALVGASDAPGAPPAAGPDQSEGEGEAGAAVAPAAAPEAREGLRARFLEARALQAEGAWREAAESFEALAQEDALLADTCWYHAGAAWLEAGEPQWAKTALAHVSAASSRWVDARQLESKAAQANADPLGAAKALEPLWSPAGEQPAVVRIWALHRAAGLADEAGDRAWATALRLELWGNHPGSRLAAQAGRALGRKGLTPLAKA